MNIYSKTCFLCYFPCTSDNPATPIDWFPESGKIHLHHHLLLHHIISLRSSALPWNDWLDSIWITLIIFHLDFFKQRITKEHHILTSLSLTVLLTYPHLKKQTTQHPRIKSSVSVGSSSSTVMLFKIFRAKFIPKLARSTSPSASPSLATGPISRIRKFEQVLPVALKEKCQQKWSKSRFFKIGTWFHVYTSCS